MNKAATTSSLGELGRFVGEWTMTAGPPGGPPWPGNARVKFELLEGNNFLVERWSIAGPDLPEGTPTSGIVIYGWDEAHGSYVQLLSDNRGVHRIYQMSLQGGEWRLWREAPPFAQRFKATFSEDGQTIAGQWEIREEGQDWRIDFDLTYTRTT
jgi:hypothetical protein